MTRHTAKASDVKVPEWKVDAFAERLREAARGKTAYSLERQTGIAESLIRKYMKGVSVPGTDKLVALAKATGVSVSWLATGEETHVGAAEGRGPSMAATSLDLDKLEEVIAKTRRRFQDRGIRLTPESEARVIRLIYEFYTREGKAMDEASLNNIIELAAFR